MSDGIDIRFKRAATYLDNEGNPKEEIANYRLLYGEAIYLSDLDYLITGCKGHIEIPVENREFATVFQEAQKENQIVNTPFTLETDTITLYKNKSNRAKIIPQK